MNAFDTFVNCLLNDNVSNEAKSHQLKLRYDILDDVQKAITDTFFITLCGYGLGSIIKEDTVIFERESNHI